MVLAVSREAIAQAVTAKLTAAGVSAYELDDLKAMASLPPNYAELHLSSRTPGVRRSSSLSGIFGWRLQLRITAKTVGNAHVLLDRAHDGLYGTTVTIGGRTSTPFDEQPQTPIEEDNGWYTALAEWTFVL